MAVKASGGSGKYKFAMVGAPKGLEITESDGQITGTIAADAALADFIVTITVTEVLEPGAEATPKSQAAKFVWTVTS